MAIIETMENETVNILMTHYYKASYNQIKECFLEILDKLEFMVIGVNDDYCEIAAEKDQMNVVAKIIMQNPKETSIDFYIDVEGWFATRKASKFISTVYAEIEKVYELKGLSLHK